jgi:hypothetical protein
MKHKFLSLVVIMALSGGLIACTDDNERHYPLLPEEPELSVSPDINLIYFNPDGTVIVETGVSDAYILTVVTNQSHWEASVDRTWCKLEKKDNNLIVRAEPNPELTAVEEAHITISAGEAPSLTIRVVQDAVELPRSLQGSNYYLLWMDEVTKNKIADRITQDYRPNGSTRNYTIWENSFVELPCIGTNFYGEESPWISYKVGSNGYWSATGFWNNEGYDFSGLDASYTLHLAVKNITDASFYIRFNNDNGTEVGFTIGAVTMEGFTPIADYTRNGEWQEIEIPMADLIARGFVWGNAMPNGDMFVLAGGPIQDNPTEIDALFFYQKGE